MRARSFVRDDRHVCVFSVLCVVCVWLLLSSRFVSYAHAGVELSSSLSRLSRHTFFLLLSRQHLINWLQPLRLHPPAVFPLRLFPPLLILRVLVREEVLVITIINQVMEVVYIHSSSSHSSLSILPRPTYARHSLT